MSYQCKVQSVMINVNPSLITLVNTGAPGAEKFSSVPAKVSPGRIIFNTIWNGQSHYVHFNYSETKYPFTVEVHWVN